ncbi:MAG: hypothetical protein QF464_14005, partial [Myxococcota bacterium]|nr:hypothetical protein [Myxococcota bacterium]
MRSWTMSLWLVSGLVMGCSGSTEATSDTSATGSDASVSAEDTSSVEDTEAIEPEPTSFESTFAGLQSRLFEGQGCTEAACHGTADAGGLTLTADVSYAELVEAESTGSALFRVEPGDRIRSYLYVKLLAAVEPEAADIAGAPMPMGGAAIPDELLEALRLWIYAGAPETGTVTGTAALLGADLPPVTPITITPLPAPDPSEGVQLELPPWLLEAGSEREVCFASYFDIRDQVPEANQDETGEFALIGVVQLRQDPQSHHLILNASKLTVDDIHHAAFGAWTCRGGDAEGSECEPTDLESCGSGHCTTAPTDGFACIGYGPPVTGSPFAYYPIGGAQKAQDYQALPEGVYQRLPLHGILLWNSHAFNLTTDDHYMNGRINYLFAEDPEHRSRGLLRLGTGNIFLPSAPPFERQEVCATLTLPEGAHLFDLSSHTHQRGESFTITHPDGTLLYENFIYNDPLRKRFDPPIVFDSEVAAER